MDEPEPTCRRVSNATLKRIIEREGPRWGITWMEVEHGDGDVHVIAAQDVPFVMPTDHGFSYGEKVRHPIVEIGSEYTFSHLLQGRVRRHDTDLGVLAAVRQSLEKQQKKAKLDDTLHAMAGDLRRILKGTVQIVMPRAARRAAAALQRRRP